MQFPFTIEQSMVYSATTITPSARRRWFYWVSLGPGLVGVIEPLMIAVPTELFIFAAVLSYLSNI
jgi:hypothetical protein